MEDRICISSGSKWEKLAGYSRAIRVGNFVEVAGTTSVDGDNILVGANDIAAQTKFIFEKIETALKGAGATLKHVTRTRMYVTDISKWEEVVKVHGEIFKDILPVCTLVEVSRLIQPDLLIEIEVSAIINDE